MRNYLKPETGVVSITTGAQPLMASVQSVSGTTDSNTDTGIGFGGGGTSGNGGGAARTRGFLWDTDAEETWDEFDN